MGRSKGLTLVEIAVILVAIGVLIGIGAGIIGQLIKNTKFKEGKEVVKHLKEAVIGYLITAGKLPCDSQETCDPPEKRYTQLGRAVDPWGHPVVYTYWGPLRDTGDICSETSTGITVQVCGSDPTCSSPLQTVQNVAFLLLSKGENRNKQTAGNGRQDTNITVNIYDFGTNADDDISDGDASSSGYDDIALFVTLEELKERFGCEGQPGTVTTCVHWTSPIVVYNMSGFSLCFNGDKVDPGDAYRVYPNETVESLYFRGIGFGFGIVRLFFVCDETIAPEGSFTYADAVGADADGDCLVNYDGGGSLSDR